MIEHARKNSLILSTFVFFNIYQILYLTYSH